MKTYLDLPEKGLRLVDVMRYYLFLHYVNRLCHLESTFEAVVTWFKTPNAEGITSLEIFSTSPKRFEDYLEDREWSVI